MRNFTLGRVWGIPIRVNVSLLVFLPILAWLIGSGAQIAVYAGLIEKLAPVTIDPAVLAAESRWTVGILAAVGLFVSVAIHELGHAWAAMRYGVTVESITLWILGGLASLSSVPREWNREFWIAVAGPAASVLVAGVCLGALNVLPRSTPTVFVFVVGWLAITNVVLTVFNMLPAFPMDGGRVLRALLARNRPYASATRTAARVGTGFALLFAIVGVLAFSPILFLLALFIYAAATGESRTVIMGELLDGLTVGDLVTAEGVDGDTPVADLLPRLLGARRSELPVLGTDGRVVGAITANALRGLDADAYRTTTVADMVETDLPRLNADTSAFEGLVELDSARSEVALVERDGSLVGVVSRSDYGAALALRRGQEPF